MAKIKTIQVKGKEISVTEIGDQDYISLTDIVRDEEGEDLIRNWMRNRNTVEFLGLWETLNNESFKGVEFDTFRKEAGLNSFTLTPKKWIEGTGAIGIISKPGRGGGTYAHKDIAFEFATWLSPQFKLYLIKEFQRLKEQESNKYNIEWNIKRVLSKANYAIHTDAIKAHIIPVVNLPQDKEWLAYAEEADLLNMALFGCTAKQWREVNSAASADGKNLRDVASINELTVLSNLEALNATMIKQGLDKRARFMFLVDTAKDQLKSLNQLNFIKALKYTSNSTYTIALEEHKRGSDGNDLSGFNKKLKQALDHNPREDKDE